MVLSRAILFSRATNRRPERIRLNFNIREDVQKIIEKILTKNSETTNISKETILKKDSSISIINIFKNIETITEWLKNNIFVKDDVTIGKFLDFIKENVVMIYIASDNLEDAFTFLLF